MIFLELKNENGSVIDGSQLSNPDKSLLQAFSRANESDSSS